jgi:hypothetical protein
MVGEMQCDGYQKCDGHPLAVVAPTGTLLAVGDKNLIENTPSVKS